VSGPPGQKEAPQIVGASGGAELTEVADTATETGEGSVVNFPVRVTNRAHGESAHGVASTSGERLGQAAGGGRPTAPGVSSTSHNSIRRV